MNKNLKKVISSIAALAISASSFVALAATSFPDVEETASYAKAIKELVGLGIVNGYEDGTFGPDKLVTRAEITKMIVAALGMTSTAEASANSATQFSDVPAGHWAAGYVTVGTQQGFINGMGDGTFDPDANVQFLQAEKMLVGACGYTTWAENAGGWPSGYSSYANSLNLAKNVEGSPSNTTELNRGQVAQLISNAIDTPVVVQDGYETNWTGQVAKLVQKNGHGDEYQTLLTKKHNAYKVNGRVTATYRTGGVDDGEVTFQVEKAENFDDTYYQGNDSDDVISIDAIAGDSGAEDYLLEYAEAIIQENDNDEWEIISITSTTKNDIVSFDTDDYDDENSGNKDTDGTYKSGYDSKILYFFTDDSKRKTSSYKLNGYNNGDEDDVVYYVNGVKYDGFTAENFEEYVTNNDGGTITLVDAPATGSSSTDGRYDYVMITYYADAIVDGVTESTSTPKINFSSNDKRIDGSLTVDLDDDDTSYSFTLDGADIAVSDLAEYDVLSIAYDVTGDFDDSKFYDVLVSRNVVTGKVTAVGGEDGYQISGTYYEPNTSEGLLEDLVDDNGDYTSDDIKSGTEYTLYLNAFGKFVDYEEGEGSVKNLVVLESVYMQYGSDWYVSYYDQTGVKQSRKIKNSGSNIEDIVTTIYTGAKWDSSDTTYNNVNNFLDGEQVAYYDRVAEISVNSSNEVSFKKAYSATSTSDTTDGDQYYAKSNKIGSIKLSDSTVILDFTDYDDGEVGVWSSSSFVDESDYVAYAYSKSTSNSTYRFVIVADGASDISGSSSMAVYSSLSETTNKDDESAQQIKAYVNGEETYLVVATDIDVEDYDLSEGTPFFYTLDGDDYVDEIYPIFDSSASSALSDEDDFRDTVFAAAKAETTYGSFDANLTSTFFDAANGDKDEDGSVNFGTKSSEAYIHFGPVVEKNSTGVTLAAYNDTYTDGTLTTNIDKCDDYSYADGMVAYVYDYKYSSTKRMSTGTKSAINKTYIGSSELLDGKGGSYVNWDAVGSVSYALVKVYDGDATEALVITNND